MSKANAGVVVLSTHTEAEDAVKELQRSGFDMKKLSIVGKDYHSEEHNVGHPDLQEAKALLGKLTH